MRKFDEDYLSLLRDVYVTGTDKDDRTGVGTRSVFFRHVRHDLSAGFPMVTVKRIPFKNVIFELFWFLQGDTNTAYLKKNNVKIWDDWANSSGDLGPIYGKQWRFWETNEGNNTISFIDQIQNVIQEIKQNPNSRRLLVSAWNVAQLSDMALQPCHHNFQFYCAQNKLNLKFSMRSSDLFLGLPTNFASYSLLTHMVAQVCNMQVGEVVYEGTDVHIYKNHFEQIKLQLQRPVIHTLPEIWLNPEIKNIDDFWRLHTAENPTVKLLNYESYPAIKAPIAV